MNNTSEESGRSGGSKVSCAICFLALTIATTAVGQNMVTNLSQLSHEPFRRDHSFYLPWTPWQWRAFSIGGGEPWWLDCSQLPCTGLLPASANLSTNLQAHGVQVVSVLLTKNVLTGETTLQPDGSTDVVVRIQAPSDYQPGALSEDRWVWSYWQQATNCPDCFGIEGVIPAPIVELHVLLADAADHATYQSNILAEEVEAEAKFEAMAAATASADARATAAVGRFGAMIEDAGGGGMMLKDSGNPCTITNEAEPFAVLNITMDGQGCSLTWASCTDHVYVVQAASSLTETTSWADAAWMWGSDGTTSWTDTNALTLQAEFYKVVRANPTNSNNGIPYGWAVSYGLDLLDPNLASADHDGDGATNLQEFECGTDPTNSNSHPPSAKVTVSEVVCAGSTGNAASAPPFTVLHNFTGGADGAYPQSTLVRGSDGNFYGTTYGGGIGLGTVFAISPTGSLTTLHQFTGRPDGAYPKAGLVQGSDGNFYGTTILEGNAYKGMVFAISPTGGVVALHSFTGYEDGAYPYAWLVQGSDGSFYGTAFEGLMNLGTVFAVSPTGSLTSLYQFTGADGGHPYAGLVQGADGNFHGTTYSGGTNGFGTVFSISSTGVLTTLYQFSNGADGGHPYAGLVQGSDGNFYGTTSSGGTSNYGTVFSINSAGSLTTMHSFSGTDGAYPYASLIQGSDGNFFGTTHSGGANDAGTVFGFQPGFSSYTWSISNGTITAGLGTPYITWTAGDPGITTLDLLVTTASGCSARTSKTVVVNPVSPCLIVGNDTVDPQSTNNVYWGPSGSGLHYQWSITGNGTLTSADDLQFVSLSVGAEGAVQVDLTVSKSDTNTCSSSCTKAVMVGNTPSTLTPNVGWWKFNETEGTNALDSSGNANTGFLEGNPLPTWTNGISDKALWFGGSLNQVRVVDHASLTPSNAISITAWVSASPATSGVILSKWTTGGSNGSYALSIYQGHVVFDLFLNGSYSSVTGATALVDANWHHIAAVYDGSQARILVDGLANGNSSATGAIDVVNAALLIGRATDGSSFPGRITDVRIFGYGVSDAIVSQLFNVDTDQDGNPDWWMQLHFGHPTGQVEDNSRAIDDTDADGLTNLDEYLRNTDPNWYDTPMDFVVNGGHPYSPSLTVTIQPQNTNYPDFLVSLNPSMSNATMLANPGGPISYILTDQGDGAYCLYLQYADAQGRSHDNVVSRVVTVERAGPVVYIASPASTNVINQAFITLQAVAFEADQALPEAGRPLQIWINGERFWDRTGTNIVVERLPVPPGASSFTVIIQAADQAGQTNQVSQTWSVDTSTATNAPSLLAVNIPTSMLLPQVDSIWLEGDMDNKYALVNAIVSSDTGDVTTNLLQVRQQHFEGLVPLQSGTNQLVLLASYAAGNASSESFTIINSNRYQAAFTSPVFGEFANAPSNTVSGYVSTNFDAGLSSQTNVLGVTINGVAAVLHWDQVDAVGNVPFVSAQQIPLGVPITGEVVVDGSPVDPAPSIPPAQSQSYEVTHKETWYEQIPVGEGGPTRDLGGNCPTANRWTYRRTSDTLDSNTPVHVMTDSEYSDGQACGDDLDGVSWSLIQPPDVETFTEPGPETRALSFGMFSDSRGHSKGGIPHKVYVPGPWCCPTGNIVDFSLPDRTDDNYCHGYLRGWGCLGLKITLDHFEIGLYDSPTYLSRYRGTGSIRFRAPRQYGTNTTVIFTFEGVDYGRATGTALDLSQVQFRGQAPVAYSNEAQTVSYLLTVDGGREYTISQDDFQWPTPPVQTYHYSYNYCGPWPGDCTWGDNRYTTAQHWLSWENFHNAAVQIREHDVGLGPWTNRSDLKKSAKKLRAAYTQRVGGSGMINHWDYHDMIAEINQLGKWSAYIYFGHGFVDQGNVTVAGYTGVKCSDPNPNGWPCYPGLVDMQAYPYRLTDMASNFATGKGVPRLVIILACEVDAGNSWQSALTDAGAKLVVFTGQTGDAATQGGALDKFFESLAAETTVNEALIAANAFITDQNENHGGSGSPMTPAFGTGVSGSSTFKDLFKE